MNLTPLEIALISIIITAIIALTIDNAYIRFKFERGIRRILKKPLISVRLNTRCVYCENGLFFLHGISIKNKMTFTHKIPKTFCNSPVTLNWRGFCDYFADNSFKLYKPLKVEELKKEYLKCSMKTTSYPEKRSVDMYKESEVTVEFLAEFLEVDFNKPLNEIKKVGDLHLHTRNLQPILEPSSEKEIYVVSKEFGLIGKMNIKIPEDLHEKAPIPDPKDLEKIRKLPTVLCDVGVVGLRWPLRFEIIETSVK